MKPSTLRPIPPMTFHFVRAEFWLVVVPLAAMFVALKVWSFVLGVQLIHRVSPETLRLLNKTILGESMSLAFWLAIAALALRFAWTRTIRKAPRVSASPVAATKSAESERGR